MAKTFSDLSPEKRKQIHNAALQVFAENGYKRANTQEIAYKAGISKGLLFYYFKNKQSLCLHLLNWAIEQIEIQLKDDIHQSKDFFQRLECLPTAGMLRPSQFFPAAAGTVLAASADTADSPLYRAGALALPGDVESASAFLGGLGHLQRSGVEHLAGALAAGGCSRR